MLTEEAGGEHPHVELFDYQDLQLYLPESLLEDNGYTGDVKRRTVREITDFFVWKQAWRNYIVGLLAHIQSLKPELKTYEKYIKNYSNQFSWHTVYNYDMEFRTLVQEGKINSFTEVNVELYEKWFIIPQGRVRRTLDAIKNNPFAKPKPRLANIPTALGITRQYAWSMWVLVDIMQFIDEILCGTIAHEMYRVPIIRTLLLHQEEVV